MPDEWRDLRAGPIEGPRGLELQAWDPAAFFALPEYSTSMPTGFREGHVWRRHVRYPVPDRWVTGTDGYRDSIRGREPIATWREVVLLEADEILRLHVPTATWFGVDRRNFYRHVSAADLRDVLATLRRSPRRPATSWADPKADERTPSRA